MEYFGPSEAPSFKGAGPVGLSRLQDLTLRPYSPVQELLLVLWTTGFGKQLALRKLLTLDA